MKLIFVFVGILFFFDMSVSATVLGTVLAVRAVLCAKGTAELADKLEVCIDDLRLPSKFYTMTQECCPGLENAHNGKEFRLWFCDHALQEVTECGKCQEKALNDAGEVDEIKKLLEPLKECGKKAVKGQAGEEDSDEDDSEEKEKKKPEDEDSEEDDSEEEDSEEEDSEEEGILKKEPEDEDSEEEGILKKPEDEDSEEEGILKKEPEDKDSEEEGLLKKEPEDEDSEEDDSEEDDSEEEDSEEE